MSTRKDAAARWGLLIVLGTAALSASVAWEIRAAAPPVKPPAAAKPAAPADPAAPAAEKPAEATKPATPADPPALAAAGKPAPAKPGAPAAGKSAAAAKPAAPAAPPAPSGDEAKVVLPLAEVPPVQLVSHTLAQLREMYPAFRHEPFEKAGFNAVALPFLYTGPAASQPEALAMSFLLSNGLDWSPGNYCTRHAYFVFKRSEEEMLSLQKRYSEPVITRLVKEWGGTHAVGGSLTRTAQGLTGTLQIFDAAGKVVFTRDYRRPRDFFQVLGDMCVDAVGFFGPPASPALAEHLRKPRCRNRESILDLGKAAFAEEKSEAEWNLYRQILKRDPDFAEVRYWFANQSQWKTGNRHHYALEVARAIESWCFVTAACDFEPDECADKALAAKHPAWLDRVEALTGPDHPHLVMRRLELAFKAETISPEALEHATRVAARYPNQYWLLWYLGRIYNRGHRLGSDAEMSAGIYLAAAQSRYWTSLGGKDDAVSHAALAMTNLGRDDLAASLLMPILKRNLAADEADVGAWRGLVLGEAFLHLGRYVDALEPLEAACRFYAADRPERPRVATLAGIAAVHAGRPDLLDRILQKHGDLMDAGGGLDLVEGYRDLAAGRPVDAVALVKREVEGGRSWWRYVEETVFAAQADLLAGKKERRGSIRDLLRQDLSDRRFWILWDAYDRREPRAESVFLYEYLNRTRAYDPWVPQAVAAWRQRGRKFADAPPLTTEQVIERLAEFEPIPWLVPGRFADSADEVKAQKVVRGMPPATIEATVFRLLDQKEFDRAEDLARRYLHLGMDWEHFPVGVQATSLLHRVNEAREPAAKTTKNVK